LRDAETGVPADCLRQPLHVSRLLKNLVASPTLHQATSVIALQKTVTFNMRLLNYKASQVDPKVIARAARENLNHTVCKSKATRDLIDMGVQYIYLYSGNDAKLITRVAIDKYRC
jgi:hypothetical protein